MAKIKIKEVQKKLINIYYKLGKELNEVYDMLKSIEKYGEEV